MTGGVGLRTGCRVGEARAGTDGYFIALLGRRQARASGVSKVDGVRGYSAAENIKMPLAKSELANKFACIEARGASSF
jgi:hypothetical protein